MTDAVANGFDDPRVLVGSFESLDYNLCNVGFQHDSCYLEEVNISLERTVRFEYYNLAMVSVAIRRSIVNCSPYDALRYIRKAMEPLFDTVN